MTTAQAPVDNHILVVGDDDFLLELVVANLAPRLAALTISSVRLEEILPPLTGAKYIAATCRLVVLALSRSSNEPVVVLAQAGLTPLIGAVPLLIISDRPSAADLTRGIFLLPFPFCAIALQQTAVALLAGSILSDLTLPGEHNHRVRSPS